VATKAIYWLKHPHHFCLFDFTYLGFVLHPGKYIDIYALNQWTSQATLALRLVKGIYPKENAKECLKLKTKLV